MVAVAAFDEDHVTLAVRSLVLRLEYVPVAVNCTAWPEATDVRIGDTVMARSTAGVTVRAATPGMEVDGSVAVIVTAPLDTPVASPCDPLALEMVAVAAFEVLQVTVSVRFLVLRSE